MKTNIWNIIFFIWFALMLPGELLAQTVTARIHAMSSFSQLSRLIVPRNYAGDKVICRQIISRYDSLTYRLTDELVYYKYNGYYNLTSLQELQGKRAKAVSSLT